jgi:hypothetical protein
MAIAFGLAWEGWPKRAADCEFAPMPNLTSGVLGFEDGSPVLGQDVTLPRNVAFAFWQSHGVPQLLEGNATVELVPLGPEPAPGYSGLVTPADPLQPGEPTCSVSIRHSSSATSSTTRHPRRP